MKPSRIVLKEVQDLLGNVHYNIYMVYNDHPFTDLENILFSSKDEAEAQTMFGEVRERLLNGYPKETLLESWDLPVKELTLD